MTNGRDLVIVGGGASGMAAAIFAARQYPSWRILLLEKQPRVGKKLLATGNGTCNISHLNATVEHYHGRCREFAAEALARFSPSETMDFFDSLGVPCTVRENGRIYPLCESSAAVLDCLRLELQRRGVELRCEAMVQRVRKNGRTWEISIGGKWEQSKRVLIAAGGAASPSLGGSQDGYALLTALGHTRTPLFPSLVQLKTDPSFVKAVKGLRIDGTVTLVENGCDRASQTGEILFTEYGLSGPAVMQVSRIAGDWERKKQGTLLAVLDLLPDISEEMLVRQLQERAKRLGAPLEDFLTGLFQRRIGQTLVRASAIGALTQSSRACSVEAWKILAHTIKHWEISVLGTQGFGGAQVTSGGMDTAEWNPTTMESCKAKELYCCGEVLDIDGDCGGFNLQWAWASAYTAVQAMGREAD